jgi:hypothetical protein
MIACGFRGMAISVLNLMSITIPKWVRVLDGVTVPLGGSRQGLFSAPNGINQMAEIRNKSNWLPSLDTFRTFATRLAL